MNVYRIAGLVPGSLSLILAGSHAVEQRVLITSLFMPGVVMSVLSVNRTAQIPAHCKKGAAVVDPSSEFIGRQG